METKKTVYEDLIKLITPGAIYNDFELILIEEKLDAVIIEFNEKSERVPPELKGKEVVSDGFMNPLKLQTFPINDKKLYYSIRRRRWKEKGTNGPSYINKYDLHRKVMKTTNEFGDFLKEEVG